RRYVLRATGRDVPGDQSGVSRRLESDAEEGQRRPQGSVQGGDMTPYELRLLAKLRQRGQAPELAVFITDNWPKAAQLTEDVGVLAIRVRNARDFDHDWSPLAGLWAYLWLRRATGPELADFSAAIL